MKGRDIISGSIGFAAGFELGRRLPKSPKNAFSEKPAVGSYDLHNLSNPERFFVQAQASLESSIILCGAVLESKIKNTWSHGAVILSQHFHAYELFYKGGICKATGNAPNSHNMGELAPAYYSSYPEEQFKMPEYFLITDLAGDQDALNRRYREMDQRFRYNTSRNGEPWDGVQSFTALDCLNELQQSQKAFERVTPLTLHEPEE